MNKIALITWYHSINYGTCLQAYALYRKLENMGYDVCIPEHVQYNTIITPQDAVRRVIKRIKNKVKSKIRKDENIQAHSEKFKNEYFIREQKMYTFSSKHMNIWPMKEKKCFQNLNDTVDIFVTGSDQIWNPYYLSLACLLNFVDDSKKKIAYATSLGVGELPRDLKKVYKKYLTRFDALSVREENAAHLLTSLLDREVTLVVDPTFLLHKEDILELANSATEARKYVGANTYILCYFIGPNQEWVAKVRELAALTGLKVLVLLSESHLVPDVGTPLASAGMEEFLWFLNNAAYICTDSFHCTALSINLQKQFLAFKRFKDSDRNSQNARIYSILNKFNLNNRLVDNETEINMEMISDIDYQTVNVKLEEMRNNSERYLENAFKRMSWSD